MVQIFLTGNCVTVLTEQQKKYIPANKFTFDPNGDNVNIYNDMNFNESYHYTEVEGKDETGAITTYNTVEELEVYLASLVNFKSGGGVGEGGGTVTTLTNNTGQIKLNWQETERPVTSLGFTASTPTPLTLNSNYTVSSSPTTTYPYKALDLNGGNDVIDDSNLYLRELISGQTIIFRVKVGYTGKAQGQNGNMIVRMYNPNPLSSFEIVKSIPTPDGTTEYVEEFEFIAIADDLSLDDLYGYAFEMESTFADGNLQGYISNITAFYLATDIKTKD